MSDTVVFSFDNLEGLGRHGGDVLGPHPHPLQVRPHVVGVVLAQVVEPHGAIRTLGHREPGG